MPAICVGPDRIRFIFVFGPTGVGKTGSSSSNVLRAHEPDLCKQLSARHRSHVIERRADGGCRCCVPAINREGVGPLIPPKVAPLRRHYYGRFWRCQSRAAMVAGHTSTSTSFEL
jgi:hypothetical protein